MSHLTSSILICLFLGLASFLACNSTLIPSQNDGKISARQIAQQIQQGKPVYYKDVTITSIVDFTQMVSPMPESTQLFRTYISSPITFINCTFEYEVLAYQKSASEALHFTTFEKNITFINCKFQQKVDLKEVSCKGNVNFNGSTFQELVRLEGGIFEGAKTYFSNTVFKKEVRAQQSVFRGSASFMKAQFEEICSFQSAHFGGDVQFGVAKFARYADFSNCIAAANLFFNYAQFTDKAVFDYATFAARCEFVEAVFSKNVSFKGSIFKGFTKFNQAHFKADWHLENTTFTLARPQTTQIQIDQANQIGLDNAQVTQYHALALEQ